MFHFLLLEQRQNEFCSFIGGLGGGGGGVLVCFFGKGIIEEDFEAGGV